MGLSEMLGKWDSIKNTPPKNHSNGLGALGMAGTFILHSRIATALSHYIQDVLDDTEETYYEAVVEAREKEGADAKIYDVCIKQFTGNMQSDYGKNIVIIEIVNSDSDRENAENRIYKTFETDDYLVEAFIYNYKNPQHYWKGFHKTNNKTIEEFEKWNEENETEENKMAYSSHMFKIDYRDLVARFMKKVKIKTKQK